MKRNAKTLWLILGLCSQLQIAASLSITEAIVYCLGPILFLRQYKSMRRDGIMPFMTASLFLVVGAFASILYNHTPFNYALRGMATVCLIPCVISVAYWLLRKDPRGIKWYLLGYALSGVICVFVFQKSVEVTSEAGGVYGARAVDDIVSGPIFWITRLTPFVLLPTKGWYLHTPIILDVFAAIFMSGFALLTTVSGRSAMLGSLGFVVFVLIGGKTRHTMQRIGKHFGTLALCAIIAVVAIKNAYSYAASHGMLGEEAQAKYEKQTRGGKGVLALLMGGRMEVFCGLLACIDRPIVGWGPWAEDVNGYVERFMEKYGTLEDYMTYIEFRINSERSGFYKRRLIPAHSYITGFWLWYGIAGLWFMLYSLFVLIRYLKNDCWVVPQWYAWIACSCPAMLWDMFFSPLQERVMFPMIITACLLARAIHKGCINLPLDMMYEIESRASNMR